MVLTPLAPVALISQAGHVRNIRADGAWPSSTPVGPTLLTIPGDTPSLLPPVPLNSPGTTPSMGGGGLGMLASPLGQLIQIPLK